MPATTNGTLQNWLNDSPFQGYAYGYPHKTAFRPLTPPIPLQELWAEEDQRHLYFYLHVPFCEMRCGFCNLFTTTQTGDGLVKRWLTALRRQAEALRGMLRADAVFARGAIGGGTPTFLELNELTELLGAMREIFGRSLAATPFSVEMSPATVDREKLSLLREFGMQRASLGVQSFLEDEVRTAGRAQKANDVENTLTLMAESGVPVRNIDLIYGIPGQTLSSWRVSLQRAVGHAPEEIYLYPLYVRPLTGLRRLRREPGDNRIALYHAGRDWLLEHGYRQISMRLFRTTRLPQANEPVYVCQEDGMLGLGPGARSYTRELHYSSDYAVKADSIGQIVERFVSEEGDSRKFARHGIRLDAQEQRRRYLIKSLLRTEGLDRSSYRERFGEDCLIEWPELLELIEHEMAFEDGNTLRPTPKGLAHSDVIGPWLYSEPMRQRMSDYAWT